MTRSLKNGRQAEIRKRHGRHYVTCAGALVDNTWDLGWALCRFRCCM